MSPRAKAHLIMGFTPRTRTDHLNGVPIMTPPPPPVSQRNALLRHNNNIYAAGGNWLAFERVIYVRLGGISSHVIENEDQLNSFALQIRLNPVVAPLETLLCAIYVFNCEWSTWIAKSRIRNHILITNVYEHEPMQCNMQSQRRSVTCTSRNGAQDK